MFCQKEWTPNSMDIKIVFLQKEKINRHICKTPKETGVEEKLWHLQKYVYGLSDAFLHWYQKVKTVMLDLGANVSKMEPAVFYWFDDEDNTIKNLACHVATSFGMEIKTLEIE